MTAEEFWNMTVEIDSNYLDHVGDALPDVLGKLDELQIIEAFAALYSFPV
jgi:hypothetical protein